MIIMNISRTRTERLHVILRVGLGCCVFHIAGQASQSPFGGAPWSIPGTIEVENFDEGGEGVYGKTDDKVITNFGYGLMIFFVLLVVGLSVGQHLLDKRKRSK